MKKTNKRLLIIGVAIGIFLCTLIVGVVQIRFQINDILTDSDDDPYTFYRIYTKEGEGYTTLSLSSATSIIKALPKDVSATFESSSSLPRTEVT
ncbi:MAG TPA: ABC transporter permease, partial [Clostridiales bacterium]|nr:ABC transporter permease [Clostridiales bacterium]